MTVSVDDLRQWANLPLQGDDQEADDAELLRLIQVATDTVGRKLRNPFDISEPAVEQAILLMATELVRSKSNPSLWVGDGSGGGQSMQSKHISTLLAPYKKLVFA